MNKNYVWGIVIILILVIGGILYSQKGSTAGDGSTYSLGTYSYECDEHVAFTMTPSSDMASIKIAPTTAGASYPPTVTVWKVGEGNHYEGGNLVLGAKGETITLGEGDSAINCSPVPDPDNAPFNFGD